jgi:hypothetical protein
VAAKETGNRLNGFQMVRAHPEHRAEATVCMKNVICFLDYLEVL